MVCDWVIGADGANSASPISANIGVTTWDYRQHCMLINVETEKPQQDITGNSFSHQVLAHFTIEWQSGFFGWYDSQVV